MRTQTKPKTHDRLWGPPSPLLEGGHMRQRRTRRGLVNAQALVPRPHLWDGAPLDAAAALRDIAD